MKPFKVVLVHPEIPSNTGNIGRTCVATGSHLHLIKPFGFEITDKRLRRAGLDYWPHLEYKIYEDWQSWTQENLNVNKTWFFSTKARQSLYDVRIQEGDALVFGKETKGLDQDLLLQYSSQALRIPFLGPVRSLNLANAASVALFEAIRQNKTL